MDLFEFYGEVINNIANRLSIAEDVVLYEENTSHCCHPYRTILNIFFRTVSVYLENLQKSLQQLKQAKNPKDFCVFSLTNEHLLDNQEFRKAITNILDMYYKLKANSLNYKDLKKESLHMLLFRVGKSFEDFAKDIKQVNCVDFLSSSESFNRNIMLMKLNRVLQLKARDSLRTESWQNFRVDGKFNEDDDVRVEQVRAIERSTEKESPLVFQRIRQLRSIRLKQSGVRSKVELVRRLYEKCAMRYVTYAKVWSEVLSSKEYGYGVEVYTEKCEREVAEQLPILDRLSLILDAMVKVENEVAETVALLNQRSSGDAGVSPIVDRLFQELDVEIRNFVTFILLTLLECNREFYSVVVGGFTSHGCEAYEEAVEDTGTSEGQSTKKVQKRKVPLASKIYEVLNSATTSSRKPRAGENTVKKLKRHQDIVEEYEYMFSRTQVLLSMD